MQTTPYFDNLKPLKEDAFRYQVYQQLSYPQRQAFGVIGRRLVSKIKPLSKPQSFQLVFKLVELLERVNPP